MTTLTIQTPKIFLPLLNPSRYKGLHGGRGTGKSHVFAENLIERCLMQKTDWICLREVQKTLDQSVKKLLENKIQKFKVGHLFEVQVNKIICPHGGVIIFQGMQDHTAESIKSLEGFDGAWFEEAQTMSAKSLELLRPTIRKDGSELWFSWNPTLPTDPIELLLCGGNPPNDSIVIQVNYTDNPFFPETLKREMEYDKKENEELFGHIWLGQYRQDSDDAVIPAKWIHSAIDAHIKLGIEPTGIRKAALDVADEGQDLLALCGRHGILVEHIVSWSGKGSDIYHSVVRAFHLCDEYGYNNLEYDADGLGAGVKGDARVINESRSSKIIVSPFRGSASVMNPTKQIVEGRKNEDFFSNLKAQSWWSLRERFKKTHRAVAENMEYNPDDIISISSKMPEYMKLITELSQPTYSLNNAGKIIVDKTPNGMKSPNLADAVMINFAPTKSKGFFS